MIASHLQGKNKTNWVNEVVRRTSRCLEIVSKRYSMKARDCDVVSVRCLAGR